MMKKFGFKLFKRKVDIKISKLPNEERLKYAFNVFFDEMKRQDKYKFNGSCSSISIYEHGGSIVVKDDNYEDALIIDKEVK